jgi:hypothetical protein
MNSNWTKEELVAYVLLYTANSDLNIENHEKNVIISKVDMKTFSKVHEEFDKDNDYQSLQKIIKGLEAHNYSKDDLEGLFVDIKKLFLSDGSFDVMEQSMLAYLKKIL